MKQLSLVVVLIAATGIAVAFRNGISGTSEAAREPIAASQVDRAAGVDRQAAIEQLAEPRRETPNLLRYVAGINEAKVNDALLARIAAECGKHLLEQARRNPENRQLLRQAAQHYRACLAHEETASDAGALFQDARARLDEVEALLKRPSQPAPVVHKAPTPPPPPDVLKAPTPVEPDVQAPTKEEAPLMVGPDGVPIRRAPLE